MIPNSFLLPWQNQRKRKFCNNLGAHSEPRPPGFSKSVLSSNKRKLTFESSIVAIPNSRSQAEVGGGQIQT